jgi:hypothetical protein
MGHALSLGDIARIALLFLRGDDLENVLLDQTGDTDYDFGKFNRLKRTLLAVPLLEPSMAVDAILWQPYEGNNRVGAPLVAGTSLPLEGCKRQYLPEAIRAVLLGGGQRTVDRGLGIRSHYAPVRNSLDEIVGVLELLEGMPEKKDVSCMDMFNPPLEPEEDDD